MEAAGIGIWTVCSVVGGFTVVHTVPRSVLSCLYRGWPRMIGRKEREKERVENKKHSFHLPLGILKFSIYSIYSQKDKTTPPRYIQTEIQLQEGISSHLANTTINNLGIICLLGK